MKRNFHLLLSILAISAPLGSAVAQEPATPSAMAMTHIRVKGTVPTRLGTLKGSPQRGSFSTLFSDAGRACRGQITLSQEAPRPARSSRRRRHRAKPSCQLMPLAPLPNLPAPTAAIVTGEDVQSGENPLLLKRIESWRQAWEQSDFPAYATYYDEDVKVVPHQHRWLDYKRKTMSQREGQVHIQLGTPFFVADSQFTQALFVQRYSSGGHSDLGMKILTFRNSDSLIVEEKWARIGNNSPWLNRLPLAGSSEESPASTLTSAAAPTPTAETTPDAKGSLPIHSREIQFLPSEILTSTATPEN